MKSKRHGHNRKGLRSPTYHTWNGMIQRCTNPRHIRYPDYGGRGISICTKWKAFINFLEDMGERPEGMTLDRINNDLGYYKTNCRWTTNEIQNLNKRRLK